MATEKKKTKICKHCQEEISSKAKRCPKCGGKLGLPTGVKVLIVFVIVIVLIIAMVGSCAKDVNDSIKETENSYLDIHGKTSFKINETFENKYIKLTMTESNMDFKDYSEYFAPKDGYKVVMAKFEAENISDEDQFVSYLDFDAYVDDVAMEEFYFADDNYESLNTTISSGKKTVGYVFFEIPTDAKEVELEYDPSWLDSNHISFVVEQ